MFNYFRNMTIFNRIRFCICLILVFAGVSVVVMGGMQMSALQETYTANSATIEGLNHQLAEMTTESEATPDTIEIKKSLMSCKDMGDKIASYQNDYQKYSSIDNEAKRTSITNELSECFDENSTNARVEWYSMGNSSKQWTWKFETNYSFASTSVPVLWTCRMNDTNELLAYTTGTYDTVSGLFKDIKWHNTLVGTSYINGTVSERGDS